jgi:2-polyprenyl-3-methyl-5-hydroxy-6-metoxy-1,4-benzoquinol methylase
VIVGHQDRIAARTILDVGCGHGVLGERLVRTPYHRYLGIDISAAAIETARARSSDPRNTYAVSDLIAFDTPERFDWVVFNECLYYLDDPFTTVSRYARLLTPGGHLTISMYGTVGARAIWRGLRQMTTVEAVVLESENAAKWTIKLMRPDSLNPVQ